LERDLGVVLLHRDAREVRLTPSGAALLSHARALLARAEAARCDVRSAVPGAARIGLRMAPGAHAVVGPALCGLAIVDQEVMVSVALCPDADAVHAVRQERATAAVVWDGGAARSRTAVADGLASAELARVPLTAVLPPAHPLAGGSHVSPSALGDGVVLLPDRDLAPALWDGVVARLGLPNDLLCTVGDPAGDGAGAVLRGVVTGKGVAVLPEPMVASEPAVGDGSAVVALPLDPPLDVGLHLLWRDPVQPELRRLIEALRPG
jgi:DNA-binding transcriptional LysR family regulator